MTYGDGLDSLTDQRDEAERLRTVNKALLEALEAICRVAKGVSLPGPVYLSIEEINHARAAIAQAKA